MEESIDINENSKVQLDVKSLIGIVAGIISLAGIWFALPDDAKQDLKIHYLQKEVDYLRKVVKDLEIKQAKTE